MKFNDEADAKRHALVKSAGALSPSQAAQRVAEYERNAFSATSDEERREWQHEADRLRHWMDSEEFRDGSYAEGIDREFLELIEWRAQIHALTSEALEGESFAQSEFFKRWVVGANYALFSLLGKLSHDRKGDNSLVRLWRDCLPFIRRSEVFSRKELKTLTGLLYGPQSHFRSSPALALRHKTISHNVAQPRINWDDVDADLRILGRAWSIVTIWCEAPVLFPFRDSADVFRGIQGVLNSQSWTELLERRNEYLRLAAGWCQTEFDTGLRSDRSPFASANTTIEPRARMEN